MKVQCLITKNKPKGICSLLCSFLHSLYSHGLHKFSCYVIFSYSSTVVDCYSVILVFTSVQLWKLC